MSAATGPQPAVIPTPSTPPPPGTPPLLALNWKSKYPRDAWRRIILEGGYLLLVLLCGVVLGCVLFFKDSFFSQHTLSRDLLCCALGGITGSWIYSVKWYVRVVTKNEWGHDYIVWRLTSPWMGIFLAVSAYVAIQAGLLGVTFVRNNNADPRLYAYAMGFIIGLFSDDVMSKLADVAKTLFGKSAP